MSEVLHHNDPTTTLLLQSHLHLSAAGPVVRHPERSSGDQPHGGTSGDSLYGQQLWDLALTGEAVYDWRSSD